MYVSRSDLWQGVENTYVVLAAQLRLAWGINPLQPLRLVMGFVHFPWWPSLKKDPSFTVCHFLFWVIHFSCCGFNTKGLNPIPLFIIVLRSGWERNSDARMTGRKEKDGDGEKTKKLYGCFDGALQRWAVFWSLLEKNMVSSVEKILESRFHLNVGRRTKYWSEFALLVTFTV